MTNGINTNVINHQLLYNSQIAPVDHENEESRVISERHNADTTRTRSEREPNSVTEFFHQAIESRQEAQEKTKQQFEFKNYVPGDSQPINKTDFKQYTSADYFRGVKKKKAVPARKLDKTKPPRIYHYDYHQHVLKKECRKRNKICNSKANSTSRNDTPRRNLESNGQTDFFSPKPSENFTPAFSPAPQSQVQSQVESDSFPYSAPFEKYIIDWLTEDYF
jgi:hypothetical protein